MKPERVGSPALILGCQGGWSRPRRPGMGNGGPGGWPLSPGLEALEESREAGEAVDRPQEAPESPGATALPGPPSTRPRNFCTGPRASWPTVLKHTCVTIKPATNKVTNPGIQRCVAGRWGRCARVRVQVPAGVDG